MQLSKTQQAIEEALTDPSLRAPSGCKYVVKTDGGVKHCIVGTVLSRLGVTDEQLTGGYDNATIETAVGRSIKNTCRILFRHDLLPFIEDNRLNLDELNQAQTEWDKSPHSMGWELNARPSFKAWVAKQEAK